MSTPCKRWDAAAGKHCGGTPTRFYICGPRCKSCTPAALAGKPEPGQGAHCAPNRLYCPPTSRCATCTAQHGQEAG
ncbi:hypothetical protein [Nonomuraea roseoviolacea]|uniref:TNFR-Cys domain-containing protein n=1 Tax=Nonomuraea roseoviolacea subsp. carminata TaxID=160689 RepID=A0ABT1K9I2_9ACTN|nr:hypothetical protein [Nonomuraea roseoviolacea]MCP2350655.1 hypothetical protein [Nonomuraea roseoviolacea subsp. carminata]